MDLAQLDKHAFHELVSEATNCYLCAITIYLQHSRFGLASTLYAEMASHLLALGQVAIRIKPALSHVASCGDFCAWACS